MIQIIRPIPGHLDAETVQHLAAMTPARVRDYLDNAKWERRERTQREDRDRADYAIEAAQFVLSELDPIDIRIRRERATVEMLEVQLYQHRAIVEEMEERITEHRVALVELAMMADEVAA